MPHFLKKYKKGSQNVYLDHYENNIFLDILVLLCRFLNLRNKK